MASGKCRVVDHAAGELAAPIAALFTRRGWKPFDFQIQAWRAYLNGGSGLINAPTGFGKTWAAWLGVVLEGLAEVVQGAENPEANGVSAGKNRKTARAAAAPVRAIWITPLRALASDTGHALLEPVQELGLNWTVELRTGDTAQSLKKAGEDNVAHLKTLSGAAFNKAYVDHEVTYHEAVLSALDGTLIPNASNADLKALMVKVRPAFVAHLGHAQRLQAELVKRGA